MMAPANPLVEQWRAVGICEGDCLLLHANSLRAMVQLRRASLPATPEMVLTSFLEAVGPEGTLLFPLFNFDFTRGVAFDIRHTPSQMGGLSEAARVHPAAVRTGHPLYSFAVIGKHSCRFAGLDNRSGYGADSPFALVRELNGKIGLLDVADQGAMTFYHHIEEMMAVDYRYMKTFLGDYIDAQGVSSTREYCLYVRDLARGVQTWVEPCGHWLAAEGYYHGDQPRQGSGLRWIYAREMFSVVSGLIAQGCAEGMLYRIDSGT